MKLLAALALVLVSSCSALASAPDVLPTEGALRRAIARVVTRHDGYVMGDLALSPEAAQAAMGESAALSTLSVLPEVSIPALRGALAPVADRHDSYVHADFTLDGAEVDIYLATTERLRSLVGIKVPGVGE